jgi:hypothetical protein
MVEFVPFNTDTVMGKKKDEEETDTSQNVFVPFSTPTTQKEPEILSEINSFVPFSEQRAAKKPVETVPTEESSLAQSDAEYFQSIMDETGLALPPRADASPAYKDEMAQLMPDVPPKPDLTRVETALADIEAIDSLDEDTMKTVKETVAKDLRKGTGIKGAGPIESLLASVFDGISPESSKSVIKVLSYLNVGTGYALDKLQSTLAVAQESAPDAYDMLNYVVSDFGKKAEAKTPEELTNRLADAMAVGLEFSEAATGFFGINALARQAAKPMNKLAETVQLADEGRRGSAGGARIAESNVAVDAAKAASDAAKKNKDIAQKLIEEFEASTGKIVSTGKTGNKVLSGDLARTAGKEISEDLGGQTSRMLEDSSISMSFIEGLPDDMVSPLLKPEKFDAVVAIASDLKKANPDAFNKKKTIIDNLFELTVNKELTSTTELSDMLTKYGLSFDDYVLTVVGSGSEAGRTLNKLSQIRRSVPTGAKASAELRATLKAENAFWSTFQRIENVRRGGMVSQVATAARNLQSGTIRAPMESLGNVMDTALYKLTNEGVLSASKAMVSPTNWADSFRSMKYIYSRPDTAKDFSNYVLERPELTKQLNRLLGNLNEIEGIAGKGTGSTLDKVISAGEEATQVLNTANRWQEHLIRRGAFFGELERLHKREYGTDLIDTLNTGNIKALLNNDPKFVPEGKRAFTNLIDDSINKALDMTYANQPSSPLLREVSSLITRRGGTLVIPFPRFMFSSMELMGQYAGGASIPLTRKMASLMTGGKVGGGPLTPKDRDRISRNMVGMAAIGAAYMYRTSEDAPEDYKQVAVSDDTVTDVTAIYPMRQFTYLGEATKQLNEGTFDTWFNAKEFFETFLGTNVRSGVGNSIVEEVANLATGTDLTKGETTGKILGRTLGNYLTTWAIPFAQLIELQRATGERGTLYQDLAEDPNLTFGGTFEQELKRPFRQRGFGVSPEEEAAAPTREAIFVEGKERKVPVARVGLGINLFTKDSDAGEYIKGKNLTEFELSSTSSVPSIKRAENKMIRQVLPSIVDVARDLEADFRRQYNRGPSTLKEEYTEESYVDSKIRPFITAQIGNIKTAIGEGKYTDTDPAVVAMAKYRRTPENLRRAGATLFLEQYGRVPDVTSAEDIMALTELGKIYGKAVK